MVLEKCSFDSFYLRFLLPEGGGELPWMMESSTVVQQLFSKTFVLW